MTTTLNIINPSVEFTNKRGKSAFVADATFDDDGARYPQGRARVYSDKPLPVGKIRALLISYDEVGARFVVREKSGFAVRENR